ncbi:trimeric intracellular cation channel type B-A [Elysia marginata]|uniref:Trimeric intracellular cation channel type B-A n=1 Tax=Elysia marginata TaxID=1093978 RepID=A0AAV4EPY1_9GAST|nr:trimeric intracellular cation channel type B-A [Elysia marginata]
MANASVLSSDPAKVAVQIGRYLIDVDMFPVFLMAHFSIACLMIREDSKDLGPKFRQNHPMASWVSSILTSLAGVFVTNFLFGTAVVDIIKEDKLIIVVTIIWYFMNYGPFDLLFKIVRLPPVYMALSLLQENLRARCIFQGLQQATKAYPGAVIIVLLAGVINGNGYGYVRIVERLIRGKWIPGSNDFLEVTYFAKSSLYASAAFMLQRSGLIAVKEELVYLSVVAVFMIFRVLITVTPYKDPLLPIERPAARLLFGVGDMRKHAGETTGKIENGKIESKKKR